MSYVGLVTDADSRKTVGHHVHESLRIEGVEQVLREGPGSNIAPPLRPVEYAQYRCDIYLALYRHARHPMLDNQRLRLSPERARVNGILKKEFLMVRRENLEQARKMVDESVEMHNRKRPHLALKYKTPDAVHRTFQSE